MKKTIITGAIVVIIVAFFSYLAGIKQGEQNGTARVAELEGRLDSVSDPGSEASIPVAPVPTTYNSIFGAIESIDSESIVISPSPLFQEMSNDAEPIKINIGSDTVIKTQESKDQSQFQTEFEEYEEKRKTTSPEDMLTVQPPLPFTVTILSISDLKVGDSVTVLSSEDVAGREEFNATEILLVTPPPANVTPTPPAPTIPNEQ